MRGGRQPRWCRAAERLSTRRLPQGWADNLPSWDADPKGVATRKASGEVLAALYPVLPELWGGSADLAESNNTAVKGAASFLPADRQTKMWSGGPYGRTLHFGVREHAMGAIMSGIALHGGTRVYGGTFSPSPTTCAVRSGWLRSCSFRSRTCGRTTPSGWARTAPPTSRSSTMRRCRPSPAWTSSAQPADANETVVAWRTILEHNDRPAGLSLSRQNLPVFDRREFASAEGAARGGFVLAEAAGGAPEVIPMGTGSEVQIAVAARETLESDGVPVRVVSLPCWEWFAAQDRAYPLRCQRGLDRAVREIRPDRRRGRRRGAGEPCRSRGAAGRPDRSGQRRCPAHPHRRSLTAASSRPRARKALAWHRTRS